MLKVMEWFLKMTNHIKVHIKLVINAQKIQNTNKITNST